MKLPRPLCIFVVYCICIARAQEECEKETDFMCRSDKKCIDSSLMCNKKFECDDRSDEENCSKYIRFIQFGIIEISQFVERLMHAMSDIRMKF